MSSTSNTCKKTLVRNTKQPVPKTKVIVPKKVPSKIFVQQPEDPRTKIDLSVPNTNTSKAILKKIKDVEKMETKKIRNFSEVDADKKLASNEKITKKMNFPQEKNIYKNLIPLCSKSYLPPVHPPSRKPLPQKDKEPILSDFLERRVMPEHSYKVPMQTPAVKMVSEFDGSRIYRLIQHW